MAYNDYPEAASANAKRALEYRQKTGNPRGCGTLVGWAKRTVEKIDAEKLNNGI